jgi:hypothetical protein
MRLSKERENVKSKGKKDQFVHNVGPSIIGMARNFVEVRLSTERECEKERKAKGGKE